VEPPEAPTLVAKKQYALERQPKPLARIDRVELVLGIRVASGLTLFAEQNRQGDSVGGLLAGLDLESDVLQPRPDQS
jgi:hypothetical protein